jgi:hypothetical protein
MSARAHLQRTRAPAPRCAVTQRRAIGVVELMLSVFATD